MMSGGAAHVVVVSLLIHYSAGAGTMHSSDVKIITKKGYDWQLESSLPCMGRQPFTLRQIRQDEKNDEDSAELEKGRKLFYKCNPRNPDSWRESNKALIRQRGYYNINFESCLNDMKFKNDSGLLTLETSCNWYWCASKEGCVRPNHGETCDSGKNSNELIITIVFFAIFSCVFCLDFLFSVKPKQETVTTFENSKDYDSCYYCRSVFIFSILVIGIVLFSITLSECDQVYSFPVKYEIFNQTNYNQTNYTSTTISTAPSFTPTPTTVPTISSVVNSKKKNNDEEDIKSLILVYSLFFAFLFCGVPCIAIIWDKCKHHCFIKATTTPNETSVSTPHISDVEMVHTIIEPNFEPVTITTICSESSVGGPGDISDELQPEAIISKDLSSSAAMVIEAEVIENKVSTPQPDYRNMQHVNPLFSRRL